MDGSIPPGRLRLLHGRVSSRFFSTAVIALTGFSLAIVNFSAGQPSKTLPGSIGKGPVGWDSYRRLDLLPDLRSRTETRDFDSTDPAQQNADFDHPLRVTSDGQYVIAEAYGPGEIVSIWSTINGGDVTDVAIGGLPGAALPGRIDRQPPKVFGADKRLPGSAGSVSESAGQRFTS
jgi:hypothetical protein